MKKLLTLLLLLPSIVFGQSYPSPVYNNLTVNSTATLGTIDATHAVFTNALPVSSGGTDAQTASGTSLDNITGFSGTGLLNRTGAGAYSFVSLTNGLPLSSLAQQAANTVVANGTGSTANVTAFAMPTCSTSSSAMTWTSGTGFTCNTAINAATLGGATFAAPGPIGSGTASTGAFTTLTANTPALGTNTTNAATTAFVVNHDPCPSILDYGGNNGGSVDNTAAFAATIAASPSGQVCVYFPAGKYAFAGNISYTLPSSTASITVMGAGVGVSQLYWAAGGGLTITEISQYNSVHARDLSLLTGTTATGTALDIVQSQSSVTSPAFTAPSDISNIVIRGSDGYLDTDYWSNGVVLNGASNFNIVNDTIVGDSTYTHGNGVNVFGASLVIPVEFNFIGDTFLGLNQSIIYGNYAQGFTVHQCNFTYGVQGIISEGSENGLDQLVVTDSQFGYLTGNAIVTVSGIPNTQIIGNLFIEPNSANGVNLEIAGLFSILGNSFTSTSGSPSGNSAISIGTTVNSWPGVISGNIFGNQASYSVQLLSTSNHVNVQSNVYFNSPAPSNAGSSNTLGGVTGATN